MKSLTRWTAILSLAVVAGLAAGCAKKAAETPPTPPPAQPQETPPTPPPTPPPPPPAPPTPEPEHVSLEFEPAFFDFDSFTLRDDAKTALDHDARMLRDNSNAHVTIEGHCDERGTVEYNQALGEKRAQAARDYLVAAGIEGGRIQIISYGKERPFADGHDESAWQQNRRAHFVTR
jgi:peptidoglycan-associated lipoprotein